MLKKKLKIFTVIIILFVLVYNFLLSDLNPMFKDSEFVYLTNKLKETQKENLKPITDIYIKIHKTVEEKRCSCEITTNYIGPYRHGFSLTKKIYLLKIEKEFTHNECLNCLLYTSRCV